jgi:AraC family transcriptional regulator, regulatory protein of adaptative response / DNA-3-methyladenine glycosylase II
VVDNAHMQLDPDTCYRALLARDQRFDGRFFVAVSSTRIYCRPVCTVRPPRRGNCAFYPSAAAAEAAGYRPCLRCRPELAPGSASVDAVHRIAHTAARLIAEGAGEGSTGALAARLGISDRHLRRAFRREFGVSPRAYALTQRLLVAKHLLTDTALPVTDIAFLSGFGSVRRFNAAFRERYRLNPMQIRQAQGTRVPDSVQLELGFRAPYDWPALLGFLAGRSIAGVETVDADCYRRTACIESAGTVHTGWLEVAPVRSRAVLRVTLSDSLARVLPVVLGRVKDQFDLAGDPAEVCATLGALSAASPGLRVPGAFDGFEMAVRAVVGQQVSVAAARTIAGRIAARFGSVLETPFAGLDARFPTPAELAARSVDAIAACGLPGARAASIRALARAMADGRIALTPTADIDQTLEALRALPGIGEWTAQYIAMRALRWPDAFPHSDLGILRALGETRPQRALLAAEQWRPWRAYAVMHLWAAYGRSQEAHR